ncbi:ATP-binding protein [Bacillus sp. 2205SS5-2]|uniref:ATP-binding protein n=1 Tax=Bacillus sp. 2205SS5-2 TaxID=3109031 RepID=UPI003007B86A
MIQQGDLFIYKRNKFILMFFWGGLLSHLIISSLIESITFDNWLIGSIIGISLILLQIQNYSSKLVLYGTTSCLFSYLFFINLLHPSYFHLLYIPVGIVIVALYQNMRALWLASILSMFMLLFFTYSNSIINHSEGETSHVLSLLIFSFALSIFFLFHTHYTNTLFNEKVKSEQFIKNKLHSTQSYFNLVFEYAKDAVSVFDLEGKILDVNPAFEEIYGWKKADCVGKRPELVPKRLQAQAKERTSRVLNGESIISLETIDVRKDGTEFAVEITLSPIFDHTCNIIAMSAISRDISYKKDTENMLLQSEKLSIAGEMAAGVAHEIRNPLTVISGFIQMIHSDENNKYKTYTNVMLSELQRINLIISEFLVLAKPQADIHKISLLDDVIRDVIVLFESECNLNNVSIHEDWKQENISMYCEPNQLKQLFINLFKNALEAMPHGGELSISIEKTDSNILIHIKDTGDGIRPDLLEKIDAPFYTTKEKGTGLGLMISKKIVQNHHGSLEYKSQENKGTIVIVSLPHSNISLAKS